MLTGANSEFVDDPLDAVPSAVPPFGWGWQDECEAPAWFEYVGRTALVLTGPFTGQRYRFTRPGARLEVDVRDRRALLAVPVLRPVRG